MKFGDPVVIASDVSIMPKSVEKIATKFGCVSYSPDISLSLVEKQNLTKEFNELVKNGHETDALSASIKAWKNYRNIFRKIDESLARFNKKDLFSKVVRRVIKEESPNIEDSIRNFIEDEKSQETQAKIGGNKKTVDEGLKRKLTESLSEIDSLKYQKELLNKALNDARKEISNLKIKSYPPKSETESRLGGSIEYLKKLRKAEIKGYYPIIEIGEVKPEIIEKIDREIDLEDRIVLVGGNQNLSVLNGYSIKCALVLGETENNIIGKIEFPIIKADDEIEKFDDISVIKKGYIERKMAEAKKKGLVGWLENYRKRRE